MIKSTKLLKKADDFILPIYTATVLEQIEWGDGLSFFYTKEEFDGFSFQIGNEEFELFIKGDEPGPSLSFEYGYNGERLFEYLRCKREKAHLDKFAVALEAMTKAIETAKQNRKEADA